MTQMKAYNTRQVAKICGVTPRTVARWLRDGHLKGVKLNGFSWRVWQEDLEEFLETGSIQPE